MTLWGFERNNSLPHNKTLDLSNELKTSDKRFDSDVEICSVRLRGQYWKKTKFILKSNLTRFFSATKSTFFCTH